MGPGPAPAETLMEARIARLESDVAHLRTDVSDIKVDLRAVRDRMDTQGGKLSEKIDNFNAQLNAKIDNVHAQLGAKIDALTDSVAATRVWGFGLLISFAAAILGTMARGFGWL